MRQCDSTCGSAEEVLAEFTMHPVVDLPKRRPVRGMVRCCIGGVLGVLLVAGVTAAAGQRLSAEELAATVSHLAEQYQTKGLDETVLTMKQVRKRTGARVIFSVLQVADRDIGKVLYHPTPLVTGSFVQNGVDADNRRPGKELVERAEKAESGSLLWHRYSLRDAFGERLVRTMCCIRVREQAVCGSMPLD